VKAIELDEFRAFLERLTIIHISLMVAFFHSADSEGDRIGHHHQVGMSSLLGSPVVTECKIIGLQGGRTSF
jgi:hypothetical protein